MKREQAKKVLKRFEDLANYEVEIGSYDYGRGEEFHIEIREKGPHDGYFFVDNALSLCLVGYCYSINSHPTPRITIHNRLFV